MWLLKEFATTSEMAPGMRKFHYGLVSVSDGKSRSTLTLFYILIDELLNIWWTASTFYDLCKKTFGVTFNFTIDVLHMIYRYDSRRDI